MINNIFLNTHKKTDTKTLEDSKVCNDSDINISLYLNFYNSGYLKKREEYIRIFSFLYNFQNNYKKWTQFVDSQTSHLCARLKNKLAYPHISDEAMLINSVLLFEVDKCQAITRINKCIDQINVLKPVIDATPMTIEMRDTCSNKILVFESLAKKFKDIVCILKTFS